MRGIGGLVVGLVAVLTLAGGSEKAVAASLKAEYRFQGSMASEVAGAPELANLGSGNRFTHEKVDGHSRQVLAFPKGGGLSLATSGLVDPANHSVVVVFRLADTSGYRRILDFSGGTSDNGLYILNGKVVLYGDDGAASPSAVLGDGYAQVTLTNAAATGGSEQATAYVNGVEVASARMSEDFDLGPGALRFFKDNTSGPAGGEESAGAVSCVLVYDGTLTPDEVRQVAADPTLCPAPRPVPGRPKARVTGTPKALADGRSIVVDTGLNLSCPIGTLGCAASGRVDIAPASDGLRRSKVRRLGAVRVPLPAGAGGNLYVRLSGRGARVLREAGTLKVRVSAEVAMPGGRKARVQQAGRIKAPRRPAFRFGTYTGTTSQDLPIVVAVGPRGVRSVYFRWRARCSDGQTHTNTIYFSERARVQRGRFSLGGRLENGGSVYVAGRIAGVHARGTLSRTGGSAFGARCTAKRISWHARASGVEGEARVR